jgi:citrate lyase beta subunit
MRPGFRAKPCIHPRQSAPIHAAFRPSAQTIHS